MFADGGVTRISGGRPVSSVGCHTTGAVMSGFILFLLLILPNELPRFQDSYVGSLLSFSSLGSCSCEGTLNLVNLCWERFDKKNSKLACDILPFQHSLILH